MASTAALVVTSVASGGFALAGAFVNNAMASRRDDRKVAAETALTIADTEKLMWTVGGWTDLNIALQRQEARLAFAGVPEDLIAALHGLTLAAWHDYQVPAGFAEDGAEMHGIATRYLTARSAVSRAVAAYLLGKKRRSGRQRKDALAAADEALSYFEETYPNVDVR